MRKIILILSLIILGSNVSFCSETDFRQIYMDLQVPTFSYVHGIDPGQYFDMKNCAYSPYPLFRLTSPIFFKTISVSPGYYELTPVMYKGDPYLLFKEVGLVKYIIPVYKKELVPEGFYESHIPQPKLRVIQKISNKFYGFVGTHIAHSQRRQPKKTYLEVNDLDNKFVSLVIYYGDYRYYTIFRTVQM